MNKKYENQLLRIIEKGVKERVFKVEENWTDSQKQLKNNYENHLFVSECVNLFWKFEENYNRIPSQDEYVESYKYFAIKSLRATKWYDEKNDREFLEKCIEWRGDRAYKSNLIELTTVKQLEMLGYTVFRDKYIDIVMGVDLVAVKGSKVWYVHVTKNTDYSRRKVFTKGNYRNMTIDKMNFGFTRDFRKHVKFLYSCKECENNTIKDGLPLFRNDYVLEKLDDKHAFDLNDDNNQLKRLSRSVNNRVIEFVSTDNKMVVSETSE